jgi:hypothetical protein
MLARSDRRALCLRGFDGAEQPSLKPALPARPAVDEKHQVPHPSRIFPCDNMLYPLNWKCIVPTLESAIWIELIKAISSVVTAITAVVGVFIGVCGLNKWRAETIGKRQAELAEEVLADFYEARDIIDAARLSVSLVTKEAHASTSIGKLKTTHQP